MGLGLVQICSWTALTLISCQCREEKDLEKLSQLGHFLKGSSATLGLVKVRDSCEKIQRYGKKENEDGTPEKDEGLCLERITETLKALKTEYEDAEKVLKKFYNTTDA